MNGEYPPLIAHVIHRLDYGGLENGLVNLINYMPADRYRHAVVCLAGFSDFRQRIRRTDAAVYTIGKRPGKDPASYLRLWHLLRRLRPAIVHSRNFGTIDAQWVAVAAGIRRRVHGEHGWDASDPRGQNPRSLRVRRLCRPAIQRYVAMSKDLARWLEAEVEVDGRCIRQIYNGVDTDRFSPDGALPGDMSWPAEGPGRPVVVGTVGRLDAVKNQGQLLEAFAGCASRFPGGRAGLRLIVAGDGPLRASLQERATQHGIADLVWMPGARDDVPALMRAVDIFVLPSLNEGISNTILEAMATGRPVIAAAVGGNPELVVDGETGTLYDPAVPAALGAAISAYALDPQRRAAHGAGGRRRAETQFGLDTMIQRYMGLYDDLFKD